MDDIVDVLRGDPGGNEFRELVEDRCGEAAGADDERTVVDLSEVEPALSAPMGPADMQEHLAALLARTVACARECVQRAGLRDDQLDAVYLTGGSSALRPFQQTLRDAFPGVPLIEGDLFGGVASGLAYGTGRSA